VNHASGLRIAITGATGFIGRNLTQKLLHQGHVVRALVRRPEAPLPAGCERVIGDLHSDQALRQLVAEQEVVIHVAGAIAARHDQDFLRINAAGTTRLLEHMEAHGGQRLIAVSSLAARHPDLSPYSGSKAAAEAVIQSSPLDWLIVRPPAVYGPGDPSLAPLWALMARGWLPRLGPANARFAMIHVCDLTEGILSMLGLEGPQQRRVDIDDGHTEGHHWAEVAAVVSALRGRRVRTVPVPPLALYGAAWLARWTQRWRQQPTVMSPGKVRELRHPNWCVDPEHRYHHPTWRPQLDLTLGLRTLRDW